MLAELYNYSEARQFFKFKYVSFEVEPKATLLV